MSQNYDSFGNFNGGEPAPTPMVNPAVTVSADYINYAGPPTLKPPQIQYIVADVNMRQWQYNPTTGAWQIILILCLLAVALFSGPKVKAQNSYVGTFSGNGAGLTNLPSAAISTWTATTNNSGIGYWGTLGGNVGTLYLADGTANIWDVIAGNSNGIIVTGNIAIGPTNQFLGNGSGITNLSSLAVTNYSPPMVSGGFYTIPAAGFLSATLIVTNSEIVWFSNATSAVSIPLGNISGVWTNYDTVQMLVNKGDSVVVTNISGGFGSTLVKAWLQVLH